MCTRASQDKIRTNKFVGDSTVSPALPKTDCYCLGVLSHEAAAQVKEHGKDNDLIDRIRHCEFFNPIHADLDSLLDPKTFTGRASQQVEKFTRPGGEVATALTPYADHLTTVKSAELHV